MHQAVFLCFLLVAAGQDLKRKSVEVWVFGIFGSAALVLLICRWMWYGEIVNFLELASSLCIGLGLLGCGMVWREAIGLGDGCFFLVSGLMLGFWSNLALLCYGLILCNLYCLGLFVWNQLYFGKHIRKQTIPFLPFLVPVGVWITLR